MPKQLFQGVPLKPLKPYIVRRALILGRHVINSGDTIRETARIFGFSKSVVHIALTQDLPKVNEEMAEQVRLVLGKNKVLRAERGGKATQEKYRNTNSWKRGK